MEAERVSSCPFHRHVWYGRCPVGVLFCVFVEAKAVNDWATSSKSVAEGFAEFLDMLLPWSGEDSMEVEFDPLAPKARHIESSPKERCMQLTQNLQTHVFAVIIGDSEPGLPRLIDVCRVLKDAIEAAADNDHIVEEYEEFLEETLLVCKALPAIGSREYGILGSCDDDVELFMKQDSANPNPGLLTTVRQNQWWRDRLTEFETTVVASQRLRPKMVATQKTLTKATSSGSVPTASVMVAAVNLYGQAKMNMRPTHADGFEQVLAEARGTFNKATLEQLGSGDSSIDDPAGLDEYIKACLMVFGENTEMSEIAAKLETHKRDLGVKIRFDKVHRACQAWLAGQQSGSSPIDGLADIKSSVGMVTGMTPAKPEIQQSIVGTVEAMCAALEAAEESADGLLDADISLIKEVGEVANRLNTLFASKAEKVGPVVEMIVSCGNAFDSFLSYAALGDDAASRIAAEPRGVRLRECVAGVALLRDKMSAMTSPPKLVQHVVTSVQTMVDAAAVIELPKMKEKVANALEPLKAFGIGEGLQQWFESFDGANLDDLHEHAKSTILSECPTNVESIVKKARKEFIAFETSVDLYGWRGHEKAYLDTMGIRVSQGEETYASVMMLTCLKVAHSQPLKLRRALKAHKETVASERWGEIPPILREEVETRLAWQRSSASKC